MSLNRKLVYLDGRCAAVLKISIKGLHDLDSPRGAVLAISPYGTNPGSTGPCLFVCLILFATAGGTIGNYIVVIFSLTATETQLEPNNAIKKCKCNE